MSRPAKKRDFRWLAASTALHVAGIALLLKVAIEPGTLSSLFREPPRQAEPARERVLFVPIQRPHGDSTRRQVDGGDGRRATPNVGIAPQLRAPIAVPSTLPPAPAVPAPTTEPGGSGPLIGGGGPLRGVQPSFGDGRVWPAPGPFVYAPITEDERRDSVLETRLTRYRDSLNLAGNSEISGPPPSWMYTTKGGQQWGLDKNSIKLGKFSLPSGLLYQLPLAKMQRDISRDREAMARDADMSLAVRRGLNEEQFRAAVKAIRERKERERREAESQKRQQETVPVATTGTR
ncbi:MAG TPA: hypothetical protein VHM30_07760 [Gemmatimonadaceae bacterium]|nr:hypothetical protein [Gemmatimonadaceae bacterium]